MNDMYCEKYQFILESNFYNGTMKYKISNLCLDQYLVCRVLPQNLIMRFIFKGKIPESGKGKSNLQ